MSAYFRESLILGKVSEGTYKFWVVISSLKSTSRRPSSPRIYSNSPWTGHYYAAFHKPQLMIVVVVICCNNVRCYLLLKEWFSQLPPAHHQLAHLVPSWGRVSFPEWHHEAIHFCSVLFRREHSPKETAVSCTLQSSTIFSQSIWCSQQVIFWMSYEVIHWFLGILGLQAAGAQFATLQPEPVPGRWLSRQTSPLWSFQAMFKHMGVS